MGRVQSDDPDRMVFRSGGGCVSIFGLPFLLVGLAVLTSPLWGPMKEKGSDEPAPLYFVIPFGLVFASVGAGLVLGRAGKNIDRREGAVTTWWGLLVPFKTTTRPIEDFSKVTIAREVRRSKNSTYTVYPVRMASDEGKDIKLEEPRDMGKARAVAEEAAKFLEIPLADRSSGTERVRDAAELDESLRERARRTGQRAEVPDQPADARSAHSVVGDSLVFDIPPPGFSARHYLAMAVGLIMPIFVIAVFLGPILGEEKMPTGVKMVFVAFLGVFFILLPLLVTWGGALSSARTRTQVEVSPGQLRVSRTGLIRTKTAAIPTDELEELDLVSKSATRSSSRKMAEAFSAGHELIEARSDQESVRFGQGLSRSELEWMKAVIQGVVTA
jgi:hypothetical protein